MAGWLIDLAAQCLRVTAFMQIPQVMGWIYAGVLRGAGDTKFNFYITAATNWLIRTVGCVLVIRAFHLGLVQIQYVILAEIIARLGMLYWRYRTGIWKTAIKD